MNILPLLTVTLFLPLAGAIILIFWNNLSSRQTYLLALGTTILTFLGTLGMFVRGVGPGFSQIEEFSWIPSLGVSYLVGLDGISLPLVLLTSILFLAVIAYSGMRFEKLKSYYALFLMLETASLGVFMALDMFLFYIFFEVSLVGMYFIIAQWGGHKDAKKAALTFFIYTLLGSLPLLLAIIGLYFGANPNTFDMRTIIANPPLAGSAALLVFAGMLIAFFIKTPSVPFHSWLPIAHVEAPATGSVILAAILLKFGTYGLIRFALQMAPGAFASLAIIVAIFGMVSALYGAFVALAQTDIKRMVAYTSVNHMGFILLAIAAAAVATNQTARTLALDGAVLQMVSHGIVTGTLFLLVGILETRTKTREMGELGGILSVMPKLGWFFIVAAFASLGLPTLAHFPAEFQIFLGSFQEFPFITGVSIISIAVTAALYLRAIQKVFFGQLPKQFSTIADLDRTEFTIGAILILLIILLGIFPGIILNMIHITTSLVKL